MRVVYLDLDCCRADHLSVNGYHRNTSPNIDRIAQEGVTFTHCYCANSPCLPSRASLFSGRFGINNGVVSHHGIGEVFRPIWTGHWHDEKRPLLQNHLWHQGMKTVSFSSFHDRHNAWWFASGWEELHAFTQKKGQETADEVNNACLPWLRAHGKEDNWFLHLHYWDLHSYYRISQDWADRFKDDPPPEWPDDSAIDSHQNIYGPRTALDLYSGYEEIGFSESRAPVSFMPDAIRNRSDYKKLINGYDGAIAYTDYHIGQVLEALEKLGILDETAIIVSSDHGDSFGEHGQYMDHGIANEAVHNIPMIVRWPGLSPKSSCDAFIYGMDLCPTLCDLLGFPIPEGWDGDSFATAIHGKDFKGRKYLVWDHGIYTFTRAVRTPDWLLIQVLHPGLYPYDEPYFLHDMKNDTHQTKNLAQERPEVVAELATCLMQWRQEQVQKGGTPDPLELMISEGPFLYYTPEKMIARLERTGRKELARDLKRRLNRFHPARF